MRMIFLGLVLIFGIAIVVIIATAITAAEQKERNDMTLKKAYLYLVSMIALVIMVVGAIMLIDLGLKTWVFTKADRDMYMYPPCVKSIDPGTGENIGCDAALVEEQKKQAEESRTAQKQRESAQALAMIVVAGPIWWYHWKQARKEA